MQTYDDFKKYAAALGIETGETELGTGPAEVGAQSTIVVSDGLQGIDLQAAGGSEKLAIILHGHKPPLDNTKAPYTEQDVAAGRFNDYQRFIDGIKAALPGYAVAVAIYDTHKPFKTSADILRPAYQSLGNRFDLSQTIIVGYSMGGLVARQMIADGLPFKTLYTSCTPHAGVMSYLYVTPLARYYVMLNPGAQSMNPLSLDLAALNLKDGQHRNKYHCFGMHYVDVLGYHADDTITDINGATMAGFPTAWKHAELIQGLWAGAIFEPHMGGYAPIDYGKKFPAQKFIDHIRATAT